MDQESVVMPSHLSDFDIPYSLTVAGEPVSVLIGIHLRLEGFLIELIKRHLALPEALDLDRLSFPSKVGLAVALGCIPDIASPALKRINALRNRLAHNLQGELTATDAVALCGDLAFTGISSDAAAQDVLGPEQQVARCAIVLQAWLNGVVAARTSPTVMTPEELETAAAIRYPLPTTLRTEA